MYLEVELSLLSLTFTKSGYCYKRAVCLIQQSVGPLIKLPFFFSEWGGGERGDRGRVLFGLAWIFFFLFIFKKRDLCQRNPRSK